MNEPTKKHGDEFPMPPLQFTPDPIKIDYHRAAEIFAAQQTERMTKEIDRANTSKLYGKFLDVTPCGPTPLGFATHGITNNATTADSCYGEDIASTLYAVKLMADVCELATCSRISDPERIRLLTMVRDEVQKHIDKLSSDETPAEGDRRTEGEKGDGCG